MIFSEQLLQIENDMERVQDWRSSMNRKRNCMTIILIAILLCETAVSYHFISKNVNHECANTHCNVCTQLVMLEQFLSGITWIPQTSIILKNMERFLCHNEIFPNVQLVKKTLIMLKVELLD